ncbi:hypothetical protein [Polynucleobacter sp. MWH-Braz-FAM2G]|uniref:hypothetical protein n=1 Tax=Polynucleobacter sp. MWH-Braz-FAM2G TaxID=1855883 RepID=UPI001BFD8342|nr:hypothetical protein [Polynucleobacter sp. MWH-Braz-FAM2G]QWD91774.1 hypothetical protein FD973_05530 [Polynucleobacter sp. MWH-Braz-FAM2G]
MFGMLDYRANKLFLIIFGIPWFILRLVAIFALPFIYYGIGLSLADNRLLQIGASLIALFLGEIIWLIAVTYIDKLFMFLFYLLVDVIPADGRSKEEAVLVVKGGQQAIRLMNLNSKHPKYWSDDDVMAYKDSIFTLFYRNKIDKRISLLRDYYEDNPDAPVSESAIKDIIKKNGLEVDWVEKVVCNPLLRGMAISYGLTAYLLLFNPFK